MASITINEVSQTMSYVIADSSYATVALPITACWGPGYFDPATLGKPKDVVLEDTVWQRFRANAQGLEAFTSTYRGTAANYRSAKDYSYQQAVTLLAKGYDILVCRLCPGTFAQSATLEDSVNGGKLTLKAKYPGTFGNNIICELTNITNKNRWKFIVNVVDASGTKLPVENFTFVFDINNSTDTLQHIDEIRSNFVDFIIEGTLKENSYFGDLSAGIPLGATDATKGTDRAIDGTASDMMDDAINLATIRYKTVTNDSPANIDYINALSAVKASNPEVSVASKIKYNEWLYTASLDAYDLLKDKLSYNPNRVVSPGWDDQNIQELTGEQVDHINLVSPIHGKLTEVGYASRCATAFIDVPKSLIRSGVYNESTQAATEGYIQKLSAYIPSTMDVTDGLYSTHWAMFAPWGTYRYVGTTKQNIANPSFLKLLIDRSMILKQSLQFEWLLPSSRTNDVQIGSLDYTVPKKTLDIWQPNVDVDGGAAVNAIANIPGLGISVWGDSTGFTNEPATYQALRNLSSRLIMNAVKDIVYKVGIGITFNINNQSAYSKFNVGVTPLLDQMKNAGAIEDYYIRMGAGIDAAGMVMANTAVGKIYLVIPGVIQDITVDLIALPTGTDLSNIQ